MSPLSLLRSLGLARPALGSAYREGLLGGKYRLAGVLGRGGIGEVTLAQDMILGRAVAVKTLSARNDSPQARAALRHEALAVAALRHPGIVEIHELVEGEEGLFLVFEYLEGRTLREHLAGKGRLEPAETARILLAVCAALGYAHARGLVHRDLKPGNIMLLRNGQVKLLDFGLARTPVYMAPEAEQGDAGTAGDVYALGVCLYEMLVGHRPFSAQATAAHKRAGPPLPSAAAPDVPPALDELVRRAMSFDPRQRPASAAAFAAWLSA